MMKQKNTKCHSFLLTKVDKKTKDLSIGIYNVSHYGQNSTCCLYNTKTAVWISNTFTTSLYLFSMRAKHFVTKF